MFWARTERIGYFRAPKTLTFKTRLSENEFICMRIKLISYQWLRTSFRFETEASDNTEMT